MVEVVRGWKPLATTMFQREDSDPALVAITRSGCSKGQQYRMGVAWLTYYNLGEAAKASEHVGPAFWDYLEVRFDAAKRGSDRRYFHGNQGRSSLAEWRAKYPEPEWWVNDFLRQSLVEPLTYKHVRGILKGRKQVGPYFQWKWAELVDTIIPVYVNMAGAERLSAPDPKKGAELIAPGRPIAETYANIIAYARACGITAPPNHQRRFGILEAETVCCVYAHTHTTGYTLGSRTAKTLASIRTVKSKTADAMEAGLLRLCPWTVKELEALLAE